MLIGELLIVQIVQEACDPPGFLVFTVLAGEMAHARFDLEAVLDEGGIGVVFPEEGEGIITVGHWRIPCVGFQPLSACGEELLCGVFQIELSGSRGG